MFWINNEKLGPEANKKVLVLIQQNWGSVIVTGFYDFQKGWMYYDGLLEKPKSIDFGRPCHWSPFPEIPEKGETCFV